MESRLQNCCRERNGFVNLPQITSNECVSAFRTLEKAAKMRGLATSCPQVTGVKTC